MVRSGYSCVFYNDVSCPHRSSSRVGMMGCCWKCRHYKRFNREMLEAEEKMMDEIDEIRKTGVWK